MTYLAASRSQQVLVGSMLERALTDGHVQQLAGTDHGKQAVNVVKDSQEDLCLSCGSRLQMTSDDW